MYSRLLHCTEHLSSNMRGLLDATARRTLWARKARFRGHILPSTKPHQLCVSHTPNNQVSHWHLRVHKVFVLVLRKLHKACRPGRRVATCLISYPLRPVPKRTAGLVLLV